MAVYTADAVAMLTYLVDALPPRANRLFAEAEAGETVLEAPATALAETLYAVSRDKTVRGFELVGSAEETRRALVANGPVSVAADDEAVLAEYAVLADQFTLHDGLLVASHRANGTDAIITTDGGIADAGVETVWN